MADKLQSYEVDTEILRKMQDASRDAVDSIDAERPFGTPELVTASKSGKVGGFYFIEKPTNNVTITLQPITANDAGKIVTICVSSSVSGSYNYTVIPTGSGVTIDGQSSISLGASNFIIFVVVNKTTWMRVS